MGGGGKSSSTSSSKFGDTLAAISERMFTESDPVRRMLFSQIGQAMKGDNAAMFLPEVQSATTASRSSASSGLEAMKAMFSRMGMGSNPLTAGILGSTAAGLNQQTANIGPQFAGSLIGMGPNFAQGTANTAMSGLSTAASLDRTVNTTTSTDPFAMFGQMFGSLFQAAGASGGFGSLFT